LPRAKWSQRNNNNYEQTALLVSLDYFNKNQKLFLKNFYLKSKRSIEKPKVEGPAAYVFPAMIRGREIKLRYCACFKRKAVRYLAQRHRSLSA